MSLSAAVIAELVAAGLSGEALVSACERIEAAQALGPSKNRTARQERNARYYASKKRLKASYSDVSDDIKTGSDPVDAQQPRAELEPKTQEISYLKTPLKGVKKGEVLAPIAKPKSANAECLTELGKVLDPCHAQAVLDHRNRIRKPMTPYAAARLALNLAQAPDPNAAADEMIERGWQSWKPDWGRGAGPPRRIRENSLLNGLEEFEQRFGSSNVQQFPRIAG